MYVSLLVLFLKQEETFSLIGSILSYGHLCTYPPPCLFPLLLFLPASRRLSTSRSVEHPRFFSEFAGKWISNQIWINLLLYSV